MSPARFLAVAAGSIKKELIIKRPTHCIETVTIIAITMVNKVSIGNTGIRLLLANDLFILIITKGLKKIIQNSRTLKATMTSITISEGVILKRSPTKKLEYLANPPPLERITVPIATEADENTPIIVSVEDVLFLLTMEIIMARAMENRIIAHRGLPIPNMTPIAIPVKVEWPIASEKKAILLLTTIVLKSPKVGATNKMARKAFFIKL